MARADKPSDSGDSPEPETTATSSDPAKGAPPEAQEADPQAKKSLTPEEQMAAFEKAMKEEDWGHQPC